MSLPNSFQLDASSVARFSIQSGKNYSIAMNFPSKSPLPIAPGIGMFYCSDNAASQLNGYETGWLEVGHDGNTNTAQTDYKQLYGSHLNAYLMLPMSGNDVLLTIGGLDGEYSKQAGQLVIAIGSSSTGSVVSPNPVSLYYPSSHDLDPRFYRLVSGAGVGDITFTPMLQDHVVLNFIDTSGTLRGTLSSANNGAQCAIAVNGTDLYIVAALGYTQASSKQFDFIVGDPRRDGSITLSDPLD